MVETLTNSVLLLFYLQFCLEVSLILHFREISPLQSNIVIYFIFSTFCRHLEADYCPAHYCSGFVQLAISRREKTAFDKWVYYVSRTMGQYETEQGSSQRVSQFCLCSCLYFGQLMETYGWLMKEEACFALITLVNAIFRLFGLETWGDIVQPTLCCVYKIKP